MAKRKINLSPGFIKVRGLLIRLIISSVIIFILLFFAIGSLKNGLKNSDYFKIKDILVSQQEGGFDFSYLEGRNIFDVDLKRESISVSELYPAYRKIGIIRILPDRLYVGFATRKALAYVKLYRYFCVDEDLVLFDMPKELEEQNLPVILGLETKIFGPKVGRQYKIKELMVALNIIKEAKINSLLKDYRIKKVDVTNPVSASFFIPTPLIQSVYSKGNIQAASTGLEIRIGQDNISAKMRILAGILAQLKNDLSKIKYIDLRFKEPVIKLNDTK